MKFSIRNILGWVVTICVPVILVLTAVRILISPTFVEIEYRTPGFPDDSYGFTLEDRLAYSKIAIDYLLNDEDISFLADLRFPTGQSTPLPSCQRMDDCARLYNDRELKHMEDVKRVVTGAMRVWVISILVLIAILLLAWSKNWWHSVLLGFRRGGWLTVFLLTGILLFVIIAFGVIFVAFHQVFFDPGTWSFLYSDTLIRLFPERFWRDTFIAIGIIAGLPGLLLGLFVRGQDSN